MSGLVEGHLLSHGISLNILCPIASRKLYTCTFERVRRKKGRSYISASYKNSFDILDFKRGPKDPHLGKCHTSPPLLEQEVRPLGQMLLGFLCGVILDCFSDLVNVVLRKLWVMSHAKKSGFVFCFLAVNALVRAQKGKLCL